MTRDRVNRQQLTVEEFLASVAARRTTGERLVLGLAGPPGAGKSTLAERLERELGAALAPMDGFHLRNDVLERRGLRDRKGAPETFDADRFVASVESVVAATDDVPWPSFDRVRDDPVEGAMLVRADAPLVVIEGNYLLLSAAPWDRIVGLLDGVAYLDLDPALRVRRLVDRHVVHGRSNAEATEFVHRSDEANAALVAADRDRASLVVRVD